MDGRRYMKRRGWRVWWPINMEESGGGRFEEEEGMKEDLLETLRAGPGEAARQEGAVGASGPAPSRWTLRTIRASVEWLTEYTESGGWRGVETCARGAQRSCRPRSAP